MITFIIETLFEVDPIWYVASSDYRSEIVRKKGRKAVRLVLITWVVVLLAVATLLSFVLL